MFERLICPSYLTRYTSSSLTSKSRSGSSGYPQSVIYLTFRAGHKDLKNTNSMIGKVLKDGKETWSFLHDNWRSRTLTSTGLGCVIQEHSSFELRYVSCTKTGGQIHIIY
jgi:hypothetical protein